MKKLEFSPLSIDYFQNGKFFVVSGTD